MTMPNSPRNPNLRDMHVYVPNAIAEEIDALVGPGRRGAFLVEAAAEKLARLRRQARRRASAAAARSGQPPAGEDADDAGAASPADLERQRFDTLWGR
jgi:hypothetical protein